MLLQSKTWEAYFRMSDQTDPSAGQLVQLLDKYLYGWAYKDIERASV